MELERQNTFGWLIIIAVFLGGAGAGLFFVSFIMDLLNEYEAVTKIGVILGPILVFIATFALFLDLGNKPKLFRLYINRSSWVAIGTFCVTGSVLFGLAYSLPAVTLFNWIPWGKVGVAAIAIGVVATIFSFLTMLYTGFLLSTIKRIPLWNTPLLPLLFFFSSLENGIAIALMIEPFFVVPTAVGFHLMLVMEIILILMVLLTLVVFLLSGRYNTTINKESIHLLLREPLFSIGVIIAGILVPFGLVIYHGVEDNKFIVPIFAGLLLLTGGFFLRYCIIRGGIRLPLYTA